MKWEVGSRGVARKGSEYIHKSEQRPLKKDSVKEKWQCVCVSVHASGCLCVFRAGVGILAWANLPANFTWNLFSGRNICTYCGHRGAKSFTAQDRMMVCWSYWNTRHGAHHNIYIAWWIHIFYFGFIIHTKANLLCQPFLWQILILLFIC